jgi:hypothetical protein
MGHDTPSRRGWLRGLLAGMLGALGAGRRAATAPPTLTPVAVPRPGVVIVTTYDADGRPLGTREELAPWPGPPDSSSPTGGAG